MGNYFETLFEDVGWKRLLILLLLDQDKVKRQIYGLRYNCEKKLASQKIHRQRILKEYVAE